MDVATFKEVVDLWPSADALASALGVKVEAVRKWRQRDSIPSEYFLAIVAGAEAIGRNITTNQLSALAARKPLPPEHAEALRQAIG